MFGDLYLYDMGVTRFSFLSFCPTGMDTALGHLGPVPLMAGAEREGVRWWVLSNTSAFFKDPNTWRKILKE